MTRFMVHAAVYVFLLRQERVYLMRRANTGYGDGLYSLPAGHMEPDEGLVDGVIREMIEETGLTLQAEQLVQRHAMYRRSPGRTAANYFFVVDAFDGEPVNMEPDKCDDVIWADVNALPENTVPEVKHAWACIRQNIPFSDINF